MPLIKRYSNRKFYDSESKRYITLTEMANQIRAGHDIQVIDYPSNEDITTLVLTQIILESGKKEGELLPQSFLLNFIHKSKERMLKKELDAFKFDWNRWFNLEFQNRVDLLVNTQQISPEEGIRFSSLLINEPTDHAHPSLLVDELINNVLSFLQLPSRHDFQELAYQIETMKKKLAEMKNEEIKNTSD